MLSPQLKWSSVLPLPQSCWLVYLQVMLYQGFSFGILLADWARHSSHCQISFGKWKFMSLFIFIISISATTAIFSMSPWVLTRIERQRGWLLSAESVLFYYLLLKFPTCWWALTEDTYIFKSFVRWGYLSTYYFPKCLSSSFQSCYFQVPDLPVKPLGRVH